MKTLSVTEASRTFSRCVERVYARNEAYTIVKLGIPRALLVPAPGVWCSSHELAMDLAKLQLTDRDRRQFGDAVRRGRGSLKPLRALWD